MTYGMANYTSDDGRTYGIRLSAEHFAASGLSGWDGVRVLPKKWKPRVVHGVSADKQHHIALVRPQGGLFATGTSFSVALVDGSGTIAYTVTGRTGEKRPL